MAVDPDLLATITRAVEEVPDNSAMRLHLAGLLSEDDRFDEALGHIQFVLARQPASIEALTLAHQVATDAGELETALGYQRLLASLGAGPDIKAPAKPDEIPQSSPFTHEGHSEPTSDSDFARTIEPSDELFSDLHDGKAINPDLEIPRVTMADVAGMENVKHRLEISFLAPARDPKLSAAFRKSLRGGLILYGPPGCGKTFIARSLAGELRSSFLAVGIADVLDIYTGSSEANLHYYFQMARRNAPCVLFLDEIDALGQRRSNLRHAPGMRSTVNQLLIELDGVDSDNEGLYTLATSNQPWDIDPALRRPGRFDRTVFVAPPDYNARLAILEKNLRDRPLMAPIDISVIAQATEGWSGADLVLICDSATEFAMERSMKTGRVVPITQKDLVRARKAARSTTTAWLDTASDVANFANQGGDYDDLAEYLKHGRRR